MTIFRLRRLGSLLAVLLIQQLSVRTILASDSPSTAPSDGITIEGVVTYDGPLPEPIPVPEAGTVRPLVEVEPRTKGLKDAVAWLEGVPEDSEPTSEDAEPVVMDQRDYAFVPHVLAIREGRKVEFRNSDAANHGVIAYSVEPKNRFSLTSPPGGKIVHRFRASREPVAIGCPIHVAMSARISVFDHPYFAVTDNQGNFRLAAVPPGRYVLQVRHSDGGMRFRNEIEVKAGEPAKPRVEFHEEDLRIRQAEKPR